MDRERIEKLDKAPLWAEITAIFGGSSSGAVLGYLGYLALNAEYTAYGAAVISSGALCALIPTGGIIWKRVRG